MPVTAPVFCSTMTDDLLVFVALLLCYCCANGWLRFKSRPLLLLYAWHNYYYFLFMNRVLVEVLFHNWPESLMLMYINLYSFSKSSIKQSIVM